MTNLSICGAMLISYIEIINNLNSAVHTNSLVTGCSSLEVSIIIWILHNKIVSRSHSLPAIITCSAAALSRVLRTALVPYGNMETSTPHRSETSQVITTMKLCTFDYVRETNTCAKFGWIPRTRGRSPHTWNIHFLWLFFLPSYLPFCFLAHLHRPNG